MQNDWEHQAQSFPLLSVPIKSYERTDPKSEAVFHNQLVNCGKDFAINLRVFSTWPCLIALTGSLEMQSILQDM